MIRRSVFAILFLIGGFFTVASGQTSQSLYYMNLPQNHLMNPAMHPTNSLYIGLPALTGMNVTLNNNFLNFSDLFMKSGSSDSIITFLHPDYDIDKFITKLKDKNSLAPQASVQILGLGFNVGKSGYVFLDINDRVEGNLVLPGDLIELMLKGNAGFVGNEIDLSSFRLDMRYYREVGIGLSKNFRKLRVGVKGKMLFGIGSVSTVNNGLSMKINDDYTHTLNADLAFNISGPIDVYMNDNQHIDSVVFDDSGLKSGSGIRKFLMGGGNFGLGLDVGATYDITDKIEVSGAITDLGYIKWTKDVTNLTARSQFEFSGLSMVDVLKGDKTFREVSDDMRDSLKNAFTVSESSNPFNTWLPVGVTFGGSYKLTKDLSLGVLSYSRIIGKQIKEALTLSTNVNFGNAFSTTVSYTLANHRADNLGAGIAFRTGVIQLYLLADRIPMGWNRISGGSNFILPTNLNTLSVRVGLNLVFGNKIGKKNDIPMVEVQ